ncbi:hypothetical protein HDV63DRAFT_372855 [Trichoderma sp. SZMC 28014]
MMKPSLRSITKALLFSQLPRATACAGIANPTSASFPDSHGGGSSISTTIIAHSQAFTFVSGASATRYSIHGHGSTPNIVQAFYIY